MSSAKEEVRITESLLAADITLIGRTEELEQGKEAVKKAMYWLEEKGLDGSEEISVCGTNEISKIRMLATLIGKSEDRCTKKGLPCVEWFWKFSLSKRTKSLIGQISPRKYYSTQM